MKPTQDRPTHTLDLTAANPGIGDALTIDLTDTVSILDDVDFLAEVLADRKLPIEDELDLHVNDLTVVEDVVVVDDGDRPPSDIDRTWGRWALTDDSDIGRLITPEIVTTARRLFKMINASRPFVDSPGTYYQTHRRFAADYVHRNLAGLFADATAEVVDDYGDPVDPDQLRYAMQYRLEYFVGLPDDEFDACFRFTGEISREYAQQADRSDRLFAERANPAPAIAPADRRKRKAKALQNL